MGFKYFKNISSLKGFFFRCGVLVHKAVLLCGIGRGDYFGGGFFSKELFLRWGGRGGEDNC